MKLTMYNSNQDANSFQIVEKNLPPKRKRIPAVTFLHKVIDPFVFGVKRKKPEPYAKKESLERRLNQGNYGYYFSNQRYLDHVNGHLHYYYSRFVYHDSHENVRPEDCIILYLDIDMQKAQKKGSMAGCKKAISLLKGYFPNLYTEEDRRAYLFVHNDLCQSRNDFKLLVRKAEERFNVLLTEQCDIEKFEIMGTPCDIRRLGSYHWQVAGYGVLGKMPTQLETRFNEFYNGHIIKASDLDKLADTLDLSFALMEWRAVSLSLADSA